MSNLPKDFSDLPRDLAEEVLSKVVLVTSLRRVRSTCKTWNALFKRRSFAKKHLAQARVAAAKKKEFMVVMMMDFRVYLMHVNLHYDKVELCMKRQGTLIFPDASDQIYVRQVFHCDGLLLCILKDNPRLVVFNPYCGQPRWIEATYNNQRLEFYSFALGYNSNTKSHKILRFILYHGLFSLALAEFKIYDFNSDSWRVLDVTRDWDIDWYRGGVSIKGNAYFFANETYSENLAKETIYNFLISFDFTRETFGPRLPLPFEWCPVDILSLSIVRDEQLAVLFQREDTFQMEIWVTTKIEPNTLSWGSKFFLSVDMRVLTGNGFMFSFSGASFFIDEEKKIAVVFNEGKDMMGRHNTAFIIGEDGSLKEVNLGESRNRNLQPLVCSYVPSSMQLE
ncbi:LOW QUALITY PROTEIN: putative F-box protein At3g23420 [Arabidopsis lyrata subsp. lyrata]|uniref:LOW QUALITY PROTEIN: putative F-box protein At3g23420 n=1 Tax=Arabidopsis lyrata subsp. lyrata TaxID=81972 RepID=UPI000A29D3F8|nr:LOW QUALITY PROTEIN: putative F-box protein At3g23420 [Arabidopsis lyrata subsp. lyrata]|eukprot:XP_020888884.1 LOW QUALITY PROTEIN: putative F-box protein At3g23420 [Arabidopsis lyrata subsp. lyrata]